MTDDELWVLHSNTWDPLTVCKQIINIEIELFVLNSNIWNHLTVFKEMTLFKMLPTEYLFSNQIYLYKQDLALDNCYGDTSYHTPKMDSSNLNIFSKLARSGKTTSHFLWDIWQTASQERIVILLYDFFFSANTITFTYHPLFELFFHRSYLKTTTITYNGWYAIKPNQINGFSICNE